MEAFLLFLNNDLDSLLVLPMSKVTALSAYPLNRLDACNSLELD